MARETISERNLFRISFVVFTMALLMLFSFVAQSQSIKGELITGLNLSQVDGDEVVGYRKLGFNTGVGAILPIGGQWSISVETLFSQKGAYKKYPLEYNDSLGLPYYNLRLNYAEVPIMLHYNDKNKLIFGLGFSYGRLVDMTEIEHGQDIGWASANGPYSIGDWNILLDLRFRMFWRLYFNFRYVYSMAPIRERTYTSGVNTWTRQQYNNMLTFRLLFVFNEEIE